MQETDGFSRLSSEGFFGSWSGVIFRSVSPRYARAADIISGHGSYRAGVAGMRQVSTRSTIAVSVLQFPAISAFLELPFRRAT